MIIFENVVQTRERLTMKIPYLNLRQGRLILVIGGNGEGKTTLLKMLSGGLIPETGTITCDSKPLLTVLEKEGMCYVPDTFPFRETMSVDSLESMGKHLIPEWDSEAFQRALKRLKISRSSAIADLSKGQKHQLIFMFMLQKQSRLMVLDEPSNGLDTKHLESLKQEIQKFLLDEHNLAVVATNQLEHFEAIADDVVLIENGRVLLHEEIETLKSRYRGIPENDNPLPKRVICGRIQSAYGDTLVVDTDHYKGRESMTLPLIDILQTLRGAR